MFDDLVVHSKLTLFASVGDQARVQPAGEPGTSRVPGETGSSLQWSTLGVTGTLVWTSRDPTTDSGRSGHPTEHHQEPFVSHRHGGTTGVMGVLTSVSGSWGKQEPQLVGVLRQSGSRPVGPSRLGPSVTSRHLSTRTW